MSWKPVDSNEGLKGPLQLVYSQIEGGKLLYMYDIIEYIEAVRYLSSFTLFQFNVLYSLNITVRI